MSKPLTIKIPFDLARYAVWQRKLVTKYETNQLIKALDTWLVLKAETRSSFLQSWNDQKQHLFTICKVTESVFRHRLKVLRDLDLVEYDRHSIRLCSWEHLGLQFDIDVSSKFIIQYNTNDKQRVQDWLIATEIKDNQNRQAYSVIKKVNKNPACSRILINAMVNAGAEEKRLSKSHYFLSWMLVLYQQDFVQASEIHDLLTLIRPATDRGVKRMAVAWKCKSPTTVTYWKRVMQTTGIIDIEKLQIESTGRVRNEHCDVKWLKDKKQTLLCLCDAITVMQPWTLKTKIRDYANNEDAAKINLSA